MSNDKRVKIIGRLITKCDRLMQKRDDLADYIKKGGHANVDKYDEYFALDTYNDILDEIKDLKEEIDLLAGLSNHIDKDGDLDANYALLRNLALTGKMINGKFITKNKKHFNWLVDCAKKGCPICNRIFVDTKNGDYNITDFYMQKVVKLESGVKTKINEPQVKTKWDKLATS